MFRLLSAISDGLDWSYGVKLILIVEIGRAHV